ncbi:MAG: hypothetical protein CMN30_01910 [Sandaracinus sp.]|nr:hypothetical protein [Sandaracinus sp.]
MALGGCSFIDDFDFEVAPDGSVSPDGGARDMARDVADAAQDAGDDAGGPRTCEDSCVGDAILDFDGTQGAGALGWRYFGEQRERLGLAYEALDPSSGFAGPAFAGRPAPPAIVDCSETSEGECADAAGGLLMISPGEGSGQDAVLSFVAPVDGNYEVLTETLGTGGSPVLTLSRQSRWDSVASAITGTLGSRFIHLLRNEWALITLAPSGASEAMASVSVRVSTDGEPDTCQLAMRFEDGLRALDCTAGTATLTGAVTPTAGDGPEVYYGGSAYFDDGSGITLEGQRMDYSGDFTVQGWVQVDRVDATFTDIYRDHSAASSDTAGGVGFQLDPGGDIGTSELTVRFVFSQMGPFSGENLECDGSICRGAISVPTPVDRAWHFYRLVRTTADGRLRLCVDGDLVGSAEIPGTKDMSSPIDPQMGDSFFRGHIDEWRIYSEALPCGG